MHRHGEVVADAVRVADADHREQRRATPEHVHVVAERIDERAEPTPERLGARDARVVADALLRALVEEVELHHVDAPRLHLRAELVEELDHVGVRRVERPPVVPVAERLAGRAVAQAPVLVGGAEPDRAGHDHERCEPEPAAQVEPVNLLDELTEIRREAVVGPPRAVGLLPAVVDLEEVEAGARAEALLEQARVLEQVLGIDRDRVVVPRLPAERGWSGPHATIDVGGELLGDRDRVEAGSDHDRLGHELLAGVDRPGERDGRTHFVTPRALERDQRG